MQDVLAALREGGIRPAPRGTDPLKFDETGGVESRTNQRAVGLQGKVQEEELDSCRAAGE